MKYLSSICSYCTLDIKTNILYKCDNISNNNNYFCDNHNGSNRSCAKYYIIYDNYVIKTIKYLCTELTKHQINNNRHDVVITTINIFRFSEEYYKFFIKYCNYRNNFFGRINKFIEYYYNEFINYGFDLIEYKKRINNLLDIK